MTTAATSQPGDKAVRRKNDLQWLHNCLRSHPCGSCNGTGWGPVRGFFGVAYQKRCDDCDGTGNGAIRLMQAIAKHPRWWS